MSLFIKMISLHIVMEKPSSQPVLVSIHIAFQCACFIMLQLNLYHKIVSYI